MSVKTYIVDLKKEQKMSGDRSISGFLELEMKKCLKKNEQILLFLNKRGTSSALLCGDCGKSIFCDHCDISMTFHKHPTKGTSFLLCHYCGKIAQIPSTCPACQGYKLRFVGAGTQRVEEEIRSLFPKARVARMDFDTTRKKQSYRDMYSDLKERRTDIILGTQMLAKGLDIDNISLVGVLHADLGLSVPDFRAGERTFQLLTQVIGRGSRRGQGGTAVIQTYIPDHPIIQFAAKKDYDGYYAYEIEERRQFGYPPFTELIKCIFVHHDQTKAYSAAKSVLKAMEPLLQKGDEAHLAPALVPKQHNKYHYHILLKGTHVHELVAAFPFPSGVRIDVDPVMGV